MINKVLKSDAVQSAIAEDVPRDGSAAAKKYVRTLFRLRLVIGLLGVVLPILLIAIDKIAFEGDPAPRGSLSAYYYSGMREAFVVIIGATGIFLITYLVDSKLINWITGIAGGAALFIAAFPTKPPSTEPPADPVDLTPLQDLVHEGRVTTIHYIAAGLFIFMLGLMSLLFGLQERTNPERKKFGKAFMWWHFICAAAIAAAGLFLLGFKLREVVWNVDAPHRYLLWGEIVSALAFGVSWLTKGIRDRHTLNGGEHHDPQSRPSPEEIPAR